MLGAIGSAMAVTVRGCSHLSRRVTAVGVVNEDVARTCHTMWDLERVIPVSLDKYTKETPTDADPRVPVVRTFDGFVREHGRRLVGLAYTLSGSRSAAEDLAQEALLAAYRRWDEVSQMDDPAAWVRRVVANRAVSHIRRRVSEAKGLARLGLERPRLDAPPLSTETEAIWAEVRRLPRRQRQVIALRYYDQLSMSEIADVLGCSKESVNTHMRRARTTLARRLPEGDVT